MDMPHAIETLRVDFPCLLTVEKDIYMPRLPSYIKKEASKGQEIEVYSLQDFEDQDENRYGLNGSPTQVQRIFPPETDKKREIWDEKENVLAEKLYDKMEELKFIL